LKADRRCQPRPSVAEKIPPMMDVTLQQSECPTEVAGGILSIRSDPRLLLQQILEVGYLRNTATKNTSRCTQYGYLLHSLFTCDSTAGIGRRGTIQMIYPIRLLLTATFSLLSVLSAQSANIKISALPFNITAPGTYVLTGNLTFNSFTDTAITIAAGSVILDLKGYAILNTYQTPLGSTGSSTAVLIPHSATTNNVTVRNGTIRNFQYGVLTENRTSSPQLFINNVQINQMNFITPFASYGVLFEQANSSSVTNCTFVQSYIDDEQSQGGNRYSNNSLLDCSMLVKNFLDPNDPSSIPLVLDGCHFDAPASN
jgi:hypothetical protein